MRVDFPFLGDVVDDLGGSAGFGASWDEVAIFNTVGKDFVGKTDEVAVFDVIVEVGIPGGFDGVTVIAVAMGMEEDIDVGDRHGLIVAHGVVGDDVAGAEVGEGDGAGALGEFEGEKSEDRNKSEEEGNFVNEAGVLAMEGLHYSTFPSMMPVLSPEARRMVMDSGLAKLESSEPARSKPSQVEVAAEGMRLADLARV